MLVFGISYVFGFCTMSGVCDGFSGDWVIGLSNHINEAAQEDEQGIYGRFSTKAPIYGHARINTGDLVTLDTGSFSFAFFSL